MTAARLIRERWWIVAASAIVCAVLAFGLANQQTKEYQATATLLFGTTSSDLSGVLNANASNSLGDPQREQATTLLLVTSSSVAARVKRALKLPDSEGVLRGKVSVSAEPDANLIDVTATDPDPQRAAIIANAFADQYVQFRESTDRAAFERVITTLQTELGQTPAANKTQRASLQASLTELRILTAGQNGGVQVVDRATPPTSPSSPRPKRNAILGLLLGIALGVAIVFAIDLFDARLKTVADFEDLYGLPALATIPRYRAAPHNDRERAAALEPFRILRSGLAMLDADGDVRVVLITSAVPGEGKSQTAAGLAQALALSGVSVALVDLDLRRPSLHKHFDLGADARGLTNALVSDIPVGDLLRPVIAGLPKLQVLPSGTALSNSGELLHSAPMARVLRDLAAMFDMVVLDAAPLLPVADTQGLLDQTAIDACVIVARAGRTTRDQVLRTRAILGRHHSQHVGLVVNGLRHDEVKYDYHAEPAAVVD